MDENNGLIMLLKGLPPWAGGIMMAIFVSILRVIYDAEETNLIRAISEGLICGALTLSIGSGVEAMGFGNGWHLFIGGMVGALGSQYIRAVAKRVINTRTKK